MTLAQGGAIILTILFLDEIEKHVQGKNLYSINFQIQKQKTQVTREICYKPTKIHTCTHVENSAGDKTLSTLAARNETNLSFLHTVPNF